MDCNASINIKLETPGLIDARVDECLNQLTHLIQEKFDNKSLLTTFCLYSHALETLGIKKELLLAIESGLITNKWDMAVAEFNKSKGDKYNFYLGPVKAIETNAPEMGLLLLELNTDATFIQRFIDLHVDDLRSLATDYVSENYERDVEFYDVKYLVGPFDKPQPDRVHIAIFSPFYFSGWTDTEIVMEQRRTILLANIISQRFTYLTKNVAAEQIRFNGKAPLFLSLPANIQNIALSIWVGLHELMHSVGPLPLFTEPYYKLNLKLVYAGIEETRVDMLVYLVLGKKPELFGFFSRIVQQIIICERIARSFRLGFQPEFAHNSRLCRTADGETGSIWLAMLKNQEALTINNDQIINIDEAVCYDVLQKFVVNLHRQESLANLDKDVTARLKAIAINTRNAITTITHGRASLDDGIMNYFSSLDRYPRSLRFSYPMQVIV